MWDNIGKVKENRDDMEFLPTARRDSINSTTGAPENEALLVYADCHSTTKGLFAGKIDKMEFEICYKFNTFENLSCFSFLNLINLFFEIFVALRHTPLIATL